MADKNPNQKTKSGKFEWEVPTGENQKIDFPRAKICKALKDLTDEDVKAIQAAKYTGFTEVKPAVAAPK